MRRTVLFRISGFVIVGICALFFGLFQSPIGEADIVGVVKPGAHERTVRYSFALKNDTNTVVRDVSFSAFAPARETPFQIFHSITATAPFELKSDERGNQWLDFNLDEIAPYGDKIITVTATVVMRTKSLLETPTFQDRILDQWRRPTLDPVHPEVWSALNSIGPLSDGSQVFSWLERATDWVHSNIKDVGYVSRDLGAKYALTERKGDCTEFMHALVGLARFNGLPAIAVAGFRTNGRARVLEASDYHNWALVHSGSGWLVSDPHANVFASKQDEFVVFNLLDDSTGQTNSQRFFSHDNRITVVML